MQQSADWKKYLIVFFLTLALFVTALFMSSYFSNKKFASLTSLQDKIAIDILSSEVQYSLLEEQSCDQVTNSGSVLSGELGTFADRISYSEANNIGSLDSLISLKKNYSLLEIKDYLLMKKISERCGATYVFVLYFYANETDCADCVAQGYILTDLRATYPELRVYSFDYNLDLSAITALRQIYKVPSQLPALVINGKVYAGLQQKEQIESVLKLNLDKAKASTATKAKGN